MEKHNICQGLQTQQRRDGYESEVKEISITEISSKNFSYLEFKQNKGSTITKAEYKRFHNSTNI